MRFKENEYYSVKLHMFCDWAVVLIRLLTSAVKSQQENDKFKTSLTAILLWEGKPQNHYIRSGSSAVSLQSNLFKQFSLWGEEI